MILLALTRQVHNHYFHSLAIINYPTSPTHSSHLNIQKISSLLFHEQAANHQQPENIQRLFRLQNCLSCKSSTTRNYSKTFSPAELSQPQIINNPKIFKDFFAWRIVLAADQHYPGNIQRLSGQQSAINSSNQQQQSTAATSSSNQQQLSIAATSSSNQ